MPVDLNRTLGALRSAYAGLGAMLIVLIGAAGPVQAVDITSCGTTIAAPGTYNVTMNLTQTTGDCIDITASNVSLKLNGFIISGKGTFDGIFVNPSSGRVNHVAITGPGLIQGFEVGVALQNADYSQVSQVTATKNSFTGIEADSGTFLTIASNVVVQNGNWGILLQGTTSSIIQSNEANGNALTLTGTFLASGGIGLNKSSFNTLNNNTASANTNPGASGACAGIVFFLASNGNRMSANSTDGNALAGIQVASGSTGNQIFSNLSSVGNGTNDLEDDNTACDSNLWTNNVFFVANQSCIH